MSEPLERDQSMKWVYKLDRKEKVPMVGKTADRPQLAKKTKQTDAA